MFGFPSVDAPKENRLKTERNGEFGVMLPEEKTTVLDVTYNRAVINMKRAYTPEQYEEAAEMFGGIAGYKDAEVLAEECRKTARELLRKAGEERKNRVHDDVRQKMAGKTIPEYREALILLKLVPEWDETAALAEECRRQIAVLTAKEEAERLERERQAEIARLKAERAARRKKRAKIAAAITASVLVVFAVLWKYVLATPFYYNRALALVDKGEIIKAYEILITLDDYKDSRDKAASIFPEYKSEKLKTAEVGGTIFLGVYEQDNDLSNGKENVEWLILEITDGKALVISKYALECRPYHAELDEVTWETSALRSWLNNDFMNTVFSADEIARMHTVTVSTEKNPDYATDPGNETQDKVFLLSMPEAKTYLRPKSARMCLPTAYAVANGVEVDEEGGCSWWLRTPGFSPRIVTQVLGDGDVFEGGSTVIGLHIAVRPVLLVDLAP